MQKLKKRNEVGFMKWMKKQKWMGAAALLGIVFFLAVLLVKPIGVSTQFSVLSGIVHSTVDSAVITGDDERDSGYGSTNAYYDKSEGRLAANIKHPMNYDFIFVLAIPFGAYAAHLLRKKKYGTQSMESAESESCPLTGKSRWRQYFAPFIGGFILLYGARIADGCTSGHMMSGIMQGSISGYLFAAAVFSVAIPTAVLVHRKRS